jgi:hypothetical protein
VTQQHPPRRRPSQFIVPRGLVIRIAVGVVVLAVLVALVASGTVARAASGSVVADRATVEVQQAAAERDIERGYEASTDQVRKARALHLAIGAQQADGIANKALADLATLRHSALLSLDQTVGASADAAESRAKSVEQGFDAQRGQAQPSAAPVLLAPRLYATVSRFNSLATQLSDQATTDLTQSPTQTAAPSSSPAASPRPTPTPSPTR